MAKKVPEELRATATIDDVNSLSEEVGRCYSKDRYEDFQEAVEKITYRFFTGKFGWALLLWIATLFGSMMIQKFFKVF